MTFIRAESDDASIVDFCLDERGWVEVPKYQKSHVNEEFEREGNKCLRLGTDLDSDTAVCVLVIVDGLGAGLNVRADAVVVAGREGFQVVETEDGDGVFGSVVANGASVTGDVSLSDIVGRLRADEKAVAAYDNVRGECGALADE
jgi:hypothetical protein